MRQSYAISAQRFLRGFILLLAIALLQSGCATDGQHADEILQPHLVGAWWQIAGDPDLGALTTTNQQPVDFGIWQAADGTWQVWSCIRRTKEPGNTRLFHRWEGKSLTDKNWRPMGISMRADEKLGEHKGGLQAPYVFRDGKRFLMAYGSWDHICFAESKDGKIFERILNSSGKAPVFAMEPSVKDGVANPRDPMVLRVGKLWHCYYTGHPNNVGADYCRTSGNLRDWGEAHTVARGGQSGSGPYTAECPFVVQLEPGKYYLFRTQHYGENAETRVYFSRDPLDFGVDDDVGHFVCKLPVAAPEIFQYQGQWYIAALLPNLKGIQICRLTWSGAK